MAWQLIETDRGSHDSVEKHDVLRGASGPLFSLGVIQHQPLDSLPFFLEESQLAQVEKWSARKSRILRSHESLRRCR